MAILLKNKNRGMDTLLLGTVVNTSVKEKSVTFLCPRYL